MSQEEQITPKESKSLVIILITVGIFVFLYFFYSSPFARQKRNLEVAQQHAEKIGPMITNQPAFRKITIEKYSGQGGCLGVNGFVETREDFQNLTNLVHSTHPPVKIRYDVQIMNENKLQSQ